MWGNVVFREFIGAWLCGKYRRQAADVGTYQAAKNLRKQGVPLVVALMILLY